MLTENIWIFTNQCNDLKKFIYQSLSIKFHPFGKSFICIDDKNNLNELLKKLKIKNYHTYGDKSKITIPYKKHKAYNKEYSEYDLSVKLPGKKNLSINKIRIPLLGDSTTLEMLLLQLPVSVYYWNI